MIKTQKPNDLKFKVVVKVDYFDLVKPTYIENWPDGLINHSIATVHFPLTKEQVRSLIALNYMTMEDGREPKPEERTTFLKLARKLSEYIKQFPKGAFVRLGSRSPKDSWKGHRDGFRCTSATKALALLCDSERIYDDLNLALSNNYTPHLVVREWIEIEPWQEFRCFYKNRRLVGISQYNYLKGEVFPEIIELAGAIEWAIRQKSEIIASLLPADDVVVDYIYRVKQRGNERINEVILLECNPFMVYTDPCLFNWSKDTFNEFEFRYMEPNGAGQR
jgi:hypothetical protein